MLKNIKKVIPVNGALANYVKGANDYLVNNSNVTDLDNLSTGCSSMILTTTSNKPSAINYGYCQCFGAGTSWKYQIAYSTESNVRFCLIMSVIQVLTGMQFYFFPSIQITLSVALYQLITLRQA